MRQSIGKLALASALACALCTNGSLPASAADEAKPDPWERMNRGTFGFNEGLDRWVIGPVGRAWKAVTPELARTAIENVYEHLALNVIFLNNVLQLKPVDAAWDLTRFVVNSTFGVVGLIDVATLVDMPKNDEDFGQTLGRWGVAPGPYLVLPIFGPSDVRDAFGLAVDTFSQPYGYFVPLYASAPTTGFRYANLRAIFDQTIEDNRAQSFDYYLFVRDAYVTNRRKRVADSDVLDAEEEEDLYYFEDDDFEDAEDGAAE